MTSTHSTENENTFKCVWRDRHCSGAVLNKCGKCIAECHINTLNIYECDCVGNTNDSEEDWNGREICLSMRKK